MKFNILYLLFPAAAAACYWIAGDFMGQNANSFFGMAETEPRILNFDRDMLAKQVFVKMGDLVSKGDTLAVFYRAELDKDETDSYAQRRQIETERNAENTVLAREKALIISQRQAKVDALNLEIRYLRTEDSLKTAFRRNIYGHLPQTENKLLTEQIAALQREIADAEAHAREELQLIEAKQSANTDISGSKSAIVQNDLDYIRSEREKLLLIAPIDGYVEDVLFSVNALIPAHRDLIKINPRIPNKIIGFIHESAEVPFAIGQEVELTSYMRTDVQCKGRIVGSNPKMTELPLRLRKFIELRSWGREVFIHLPDTNRFYISEKIVVTLPKTPE